MCLPPKQRLCPVEPPRRAPSKAGMQPPGASGHTNAPGGWPPRPPTPIRHLRAVPAHRMPRRGLKCLGLDVCADKCEHCKVTGVKSAGRLCTRFHLMPPPGGGALDPAASSRCEFDTLACPCSAFS